MSIGAERAELEPHSQSGWQGQDTAGAEQVPDFIGEEQAEELADPAATRSVGRTILAVCLTLAALAWIAAAAWSAYTAPPLRLADSLVWTALHSVPLILIAMLWLVFGRSPRRETEKFTRAVAAMRGEAQALDSVLAIVAQRLEENRVRVTEEAARLMSLGDEASDRLGRVTHYIALETAELDRKAQALEGAAANARVDLGVLMSDLPRAETQAQAAAQAIRDAGLAAHERAGALESQLAALTARGREADEVVGGAAQRLGAHLARIETSAGAAASRLEEAGDQMNSAVDGAMERVSASLGDARGALDAQGQAMLAMVDQNRAAWEQAGAEAARRLSERLDAVGTSISTLANQLAAQDAASQTLLSSIERGVSELDAQLHALGRTGADTHTQLAQGVEAVRSAVQVLQSEVQSGSQGAGELIDRTHELADSLAVISRQLREELPPSFAEIETRAHRTAEAAAAAVPSVEAIQAAAAFAEDSVRLSEESLVRQRESLDALLAGIRDGVAEAEESLNALGSAASDADGEAQRLVRETAPALIEALARVRETANAAAAHARETLSAIIPEQAGKLAEASRHAVSEAVTEPVREQLDALGAASETAAEAARAASERLTRQLLAIGETAAAVEGRIAEDRAERERRESENLSRRVALLIESLNSTAIDVTKILSNEVTDTAWAAYLKGDRGVFTRRAVRLLDSGEAREIQRHYDNEPEFREQVGRYIHDFEAMLQRILADRDGTPIAVTLLSSDMGKLYVALAQAIERLRR